MTNHAKLLQETLTQQRMRRVMKKYCRKRVTWALGRRLWEYSNEYNHGASTLFKSRFSLFIFRTATQVISFMTLSETFHFTFSLPSSKFIIVIHLSLLTMNWTVLILAVYRTPATYELS